MASMERNGAMLFTACCLAFSGRCGKDGIVRWPLAICGNFDADGSHPFSSRGRCLGLSRSARRNG